MRIQIWTAALCLASCLLAPAPAAAEWRRIDSPNFIVIGDAAERELRNIAGQFEGFRETLGRVLSSKVTATAVPTVVVVFPNDRAYTPYKPVYNGKPVDVGGVFYAGRDANYITLLNDGREGRLRVLFHEYAHLMIANVVMNLPTWLNEGLAEYYSTYEHARDGREALIGRAVDSHLQRLAEGRLLPLDELLAVNQNSPMYNEGERRSVFYAQSWALTHMLLLGEPMRVKELASFIGSVQQGVPTADAWRQAFGAVDVGKELQRYLRAFTFKAYRFKFTDAIARVEAEARPMSPADVSAFLAGLRVRQRRLEEAATLADAALQIDKSHAHANVARAEADLAKGDGNSAARRLTTITTADDWFVRYLAGTTLTDSIDRNGEAAAAQIDAARAHFAAVATHREVANALADLARLDITARAGATAGTRATIERTRALAPGRDDYAHLHARVLVELGDFALARSVLGPMMTRNAPDHVRANATNLMNYVVQLEARRRADDSRRTAAPPAGKDRVEEGADRDLVSTWKPVFRETEPGEQRIEGTLERIACPARAPVVFHIRTATGPEAFQAAKFESVDFISYRDDLSGALNCGPFKGSMPVYLTWRQGAVPGDRQVVAIEFLSK